MELNFLNKNLEVIAIIDNAKSIQWLERYYEVGKFEVHIQSDDYILEILHQSYFISRNDSRYVGVIDYINNAEDADEGDYITIQGYMAESLLGRRIIRNIKYYNLPLMSICNNLLQLNILNPPLQQGETVSPRKMNCLNTSITSQLTYTSFVETQATFKDNLLTFIVELLKNYNSSIRLELANNNKFTIILYSGTDRSYNQNENSYVIFSKEYDNLISSNYEFNSSVEQNALYVGGEDNTNAPEGRYIDKYETLINGNVISDIDRKETFIDASDLTQTWENENGIEISLTTEEYRALLQARGRENVITSSEKFDAEIDITTYKYNVDYFLGDIITIYNGGEYFNKRIVGMDIVDDENGQTLTPILEE